MVAVLVLMGTETQKEEAPLGFQQFRRFQRRTCAAILMAVGRGASEAWKRQHRCCGWTDWVFYDGTLE